MLLLTTTKNISDALSFRHFVELHRGYYSAKEAREVSAEYLRHYPLNENQKLQLEQTTVGRKVVKALVETPIYPKPC